MAPSAGDLRLLAQLDAVSAGQTPPEMSDVPTAAGRPEAAPMSNEERQVHDYVEQQLGSERVCLPPNTILRALRAWSWEEQWADTILKRVKQHIAWRAEMQIDAMLTAPVPGLVERHRLWRTLWCSDMYTRDSLGHPVTVQRVRSAHRHRVWRLISCISNRCRGASDFSACAPVLLWTRSWGRSISSRSSSCLTSTRRSATSGLISSSPTAFATPCPSATASVSTHAQSAVAWVSQAIYRCGWVWVFSDRLLVSKGVYKATSVLDMEGIGRDHMNTQ